MYIMPILVLWDLSTLCVVHIYINKFNNDNNLAPSKNFFLDTNIYI